LNTSHKKTETSEKRSIIYNKRDASRSA